MSVSSSQLNEIYDLYTGKKYPEAFEKVQDILAVQPSNPYAKRYKQLLKPYLNDKSQVGKITTVKGKKLTCPHCQAAISLSSLSQEQRNAVREKNYENLQIKCAYCHTDFTLHKKTIRSQLGIKIGDTITYQGKKYRTTGAVEYSGNWKEEGYSGVLYYLEWILLGDDNSYVYFSEGYFMDDGIKNYEYEFSQKVIPDFSIDVDYSSESIRINGTKKSFKEKNTVTAKKIYGENSKVFTVGEKVELYEFSYKRKKYILEKEQVGRQSEAGIYETESVDRRLACTLFRKEYHYNLYENTLEPPSTLGIILGSLMGGGSLTIILYEMLGKYFIFFVLGVVVCLLLYFYGRYKSEYKDLWFKSLPMTVSFFIFGPLLAFFFIPLLVDSYLGANKNQVALKNIDEGQKYQVLFQNTQLQKKTVQSRTSYDYGGVSTSYKITEGLNFSVKTDEDKAIIERLKSNKNIAEPVRKVFKEQIYKLK